LSDVTRDRRSSRQDFLLCQMTKIYTNSFFFTDSDLPSFVSAILSITDIPLNATWTQNGITVAGNNEISTGLDQLSASCGLYVDNDETIYIADQSNHRIVEWKSGAASGQVVAGGNGEGNRTDQLRRPSNIIVDKQTNSFMICDSGNRRVVRWPRQCVTTGQTIISNVACWSLSMDNDGFIYVSDEENHEIRRWQVDGTEGTVVAGANGRGDRLDQLNIPGYIFVDRDYSVYVSDFNNHRVMKWIKGAKEGIVVAGGQGRGNTLKQLNHPQGVIVDQLGTVYVADRENHRIMRWIKGAKQGTILVGSQKNQLSYPVSLAFDRRGNLYVLEWRNDRVRRFLIDQHS
jgi:sugar lactone lactonase YvrE